MLLYSIARRLSWSSTVARPASRYMSTSTTSSSIEFGKLTNLMIVRCRSQLYPGHNITEPIVCGWNSLPDPDAPPPKVEAGLLDLFQEIRVTVDQEAQIVKAVFPHPSVVMQVFLQRVFAQSVSAFILSSISFEW
jgi:Exocyst complex component Sec10